MGEITVCIPVFNAAKTLLACVERLVVQDQTEDLPVLIYDNGSRDGTIELVQAWINRHIPPGLKIQMKQYKQIPGGKSQNIPYMRGNLARDVKTPYLFWLDADVIIPPRTLNNLLADFKADETLELYGVRYDPRCDHVQMGATIMRTEIAQKVQWRWGEFCDCKTLATDLVTMGKRTDVHPALQATHLHFL